MHHVLCTDKIHEARGCILNQWQGLQAHLQDGLIPIDNNHCEQLMKQVALGRKNWLHMGSLASAYRTATLMTIISSAVRNDLGVAAYVEDQLNQLLAGPERTASPFAPTASESVSSTTFAATANASSVASLG